MPIDNHSQEVNLSTHEHGRDYTMQQVEETGERTESCLRCRQRKQKCHYPPGLTECDRCRRQGRPCSGMRVSQRGPCTSCVRSKRKCETVTGSAICLRCQRSGRLTCPSSRLTTRTHYPAPNLLLHRAVEAFADITTSSIRWELARQGEQCLRALGIDSVPSCARGKFSASGSLVDRISFHLNLISGLKLIKTSASDSSTCSARSIDHWLVDQWMAESTSQSSVQRLGMRLVSQTLWQLIRELSQSKTRWHPAQILQLTHSLAYCTELRVVAVPDEEKALYRTIMGLVLMRGGSDLGWSTTGDVQRELRDCTSRLARHEAIASLKMGVQSAIPLGIIDILHPWPQNADLWGDNLYDWKQPLGFGGQFESLGDLLAPYVRRVHNLSRLKLVDGVFWVQLRQTAKSLAMIFDLNWARQDRRFLREIYSVELWAMQIAFLRTADAEARTCSQTDVDDAVTETLMTMCDRIGQVYDAKQDTVSDIFHIFDTVSNNVHLCLTKPTLRRALMFLPRSQIDVLSTCLKVTQFWNTSAKEIAEALEALRTGSVEPLPPCQSMCTAPID